MGKGVNAGYHYFLLFPQFLAALAEGQQAYVMARCLSCVRPCTRPSVRALTFISNIFFSETTHPILMKLHRNDPAMVLFRIPGKNFIPSKTLVAMATKLKNIEFFFKIFFSEIIRPSATKFGV